MNETPKYHLPDVTGDLRARVLDLCIHRLWHDALELLYQNGIQHYDRDDLINFYNWAPAYLPEAPTEDPAADSLPASTSPERGVHAASVTDDHQRREAHQHPIDLLSAPATPPVAASRESAADPVNRSADSLSAASENPEPTASDNGTLIADPRPLITGHAGSALLTDLRDLLRRYVVLPEMAADALALWVVHTYAFEFREVTTYIGVVSPEKRCGKTTLLELLRRLANRAVAAANISAPALFRVIQENKPTLLIDEADTFLQGRDELAGILNAGYRKDNAYVVRVADRKSPGGTEFAQYSCWCPKVMAAIGRLPDTLADRCIVITMQRKLPGEQCERMRNLDATEYCKRCAEFAREHGEGLPRRARKFRRP